MPLSKPQPSTETQSSSAPSPPWIELPRDLIANILLRLGAIEILESADKVCTTWRTVCHHPSMWRVIHIKNDSDSYFDDERKWEIICRRAVDLSQGELVELIIQFFGSDDMFHYISERSPQLKILKVSNNYNFVSTFMCNIISGACISAIVPKFPHLQELHLFDFPHLTAKEIKVIGCSCPNLNSFTFAYTWTYVDNDCAKAVAENMPGLCKLRLCGSSMTNEGLEAIFNCCCGLEFLDIRGCVYVDLEGKLEKRCSLQIKELIKHGEYTDTSDFDDLDRYPWSAYDDYDSDDRNLRLDIQISKSSRVVIDL